MAEVNETTRIHDLDMLLRQAREMLIWCSGSPSFQVDGEARVGWVNGVVPLLARMDEVLGKLPAPPAGSIQDVAIMLAREHYFENANTLVAVYWAPHDEEVRLIDVATDAPNSGEVLPFRFKADPPEVPYPVRQILLHPDEWAAVQAGTLALPEGYPKPGDLQRLAARRLG